MSEPRDDLDEANETPAAPGGLRRTWIVIALAVLGLVLIGVTVARLVTSQVNQDRLPDQPVESAAVDDAQDLCESQAIYDAIKGELFRRAAQIRRDDHAAFDTIGRHSAVRMDEPVVTARNEDLATINCRGMLSIDLPPGVVAGARRTLSADIGYTLHRMTSGATEVIALQNVGAIIGPLADLGQVRAAPEMPANMMDPMANAIDGLLPPVPLPPPATEVPSQPSDPLAPAQGPSFDCADARTRSEIAVCEDAGLAALDRQTAAQFNGALAEANAEQRDLLMRTRDRFLAYRNSCDSSSCIANVYQGRMREIRDIMAGQWRGRG